MRFVLTKFDVILLINRKRFLITFLLILIRFNCTQCHLKVIIAFFQICLLELLEQSEVVAHSHQQCRYAIDSNSPSMLTISKPHPLD